MKRIISFLLISFVFCFGLSCKKQGDIEEKEGKTKLVIKFHIPNNKKWIHRK